MSPPDEQLEWSQECARYQERGDVSRAAEWAVCGVRSRCAVKHCTAPVSSHGLCVKHAAQQRRAQLRAAPTQAVPLPVRGRCPRCGGYLDVDSCINCGYAVPDRRPEETLELVRSERQHNSIRARNGKWEPR